MHHFSMANPKGRRQGDVALLLRSVASEVERIADAEVQDVSLHAEVTNRGPWYSMTVYFSLPEDDA